MLASAVVRAPPKRASGELCSPLTKTYMDVGYSETDRLPRDARRDGGPRRKRQERRVGRPAQEAVQLVELPALPLPADPPAFLFVPEAPPVEKQETVAAAGRGAVPGVQGRDAIGGRREELLVFRKALRIRVGPIRQQRCVESWKVEGGSTATAERVLCCI